MTQDQAQSILLDIQSKFKDWLDYQKHIQDDLRNALTSIFQGFFENGEVETISWRQYTPYFNDGDACRFSVHSDSDEISVNDIMGWDDDNEQRNLIRDIVSSTLDNIPEDILESLFGDHTEVIVSKTGITRIDYEHD